MKTTTTSIGSLLERVNKHEIRLPEIQRAYVWKAAQVAGLVDSLYKRYPSGSLLLWETDLPVGEREAAIDGPSDLPMARPQYLLDGQQRLTSLFRVWSGDDRARVVFNVESERFQIESAATKKDSRWVYVHDLLRDKVSRFSLAQELSAKGLALGPDEVFGRLERVKKILEYPYFIEILEDLPYAEVTEIFVRVNSKGRPLRKVDLALATLSARWPGVVAKLDAQASKLEEAGYRHLDISFLTRCLAALATETASFDGFSTVSIDALAAGWKNVQRGIEHLIPLLKNNAGIATSELIPSANALVPLVAFLGSRTEEALQPEDANALVYWAFGAFQLGRYNQSADTVIAQDVAAVRSAEPLRQLYRNLGLLGGRLVVTEDGLVARGANSPYFLFSYLAARRAGATDWFHGVKIGTELEGNFKLEYHHIHPRAQLKDVYSKTEINDLANLAFISGKANRKISRRSPSDYFPELSEEELTRHFVPLDPTLRTTQAFPRFIQERRRLLAQAMTSLLEEYRPSRLTANDHDVADPAAGEALTINIYSSYPAGTAGSVVFTAEAGGERWRAAVPLYDFVAFIDDLEAGLAAHLRLGEEVSSVEAGAEIIEVLIGPLRATGTLDDWRKVVERELADTSPPTAVPDIPAPSGWKGERRFFPILDSE